MSDTAATTGAADTTTAATTATTSSAPWYEGKLDAELLGHIENKGWKKDDPIEVAVSATKQARELQKHFGVPPEQIIKLPSKADDEAGWKAVRERLGAPKEAKEYDFSSIKRADGSDVDPALADALRNSLFKAGMPKDAAPEVLKAAVKTLDDQATTRANERAAQLQAERGDLQKEWGTNWEFNRLQAMQGAKRATGGNDELAGKLIESMQEKIGYKNTMEFWRKIGAGTSEDTFVDASSGGNVTTRNGAVARKAELMADKDWAGRYLKGGAAERREMDALNQLISGAA